MLITWLNRYPRLVDWALVLVALAGSGAAVVGGDRRVIGAPIAVVGSVALAWRRDRTLEVLAVTTLACAATAAVSDAYDPVAVAVALYTVASRCERRVSLTAGGLALAALLLPLWSLVGWGDPLPVLGRLAPLVIAWLIGDSVGVRRRYVEALEDRAHRLEGERAAEAARAVAEEQARIGRELHDVIAHNLSVMVVQAAAARDVFDAEPGRARDALDAIERTGRSARAELRRLLGAIRDDQPPLSPQPGLERLDELVDQVRAAGLAVTMHREGTPRPLPRALDLSAYRIIQEALTNTLKHAHARHTDIVLTYAERELLIDVHDDGYAAAATDDTGQGLIGMRQRAATFGGTLTAGPCDDGGFTVAARLPLEAAS
ncbi:MAG: sensor histidine kinase [Gaiellales bacterium]